MEYSKRQKRLINILKSLRKIRRDTRFKAIRREQKRLREHREQKMLREHREQMLRKHREQMQILEARSSNLSPSQVMNELLYIDKTMNKLFMGETSSTNAAHGNEAVRWKGEYLVAQRSVPVLERIHTRYPRFPSSFKTTPLCTKIQFILFLHLAEIVYRLENLTVGRMNQDQLDCVQRLNKSFKNNDIEVDMIDKFVNAVLERNALIQHLEELNQKLLTEKAMAPPSDNCGELKEEIERVEQKLKQLSSKTGVDFLSEEQLDAQHGSL